MTPFLFVHVLRLLIIRVSGANINEVELLSWIPEEFSHSGSGSTAPFYFFGISGTALGRVFWARTLVSPPEAPNFP